MNKPNQPLPVIRAPDPVERAIEPLLREPLAGALAADGPEADASGARLRNRLLQRAAASRAEAQVMLTARRSRLSAVELAPGVQARTLYAAAGDAAQRPGEPLRARLIELAPGSRWDGPAPEHHRECLVLQGSLLVGSERLLLRDYHAVPAGSPPRDWQSDEGALVFLRESDLPAQTGAATLVVRDEQAGWGDFAPGIRRRVLWQQAGQAAMLYYAQPGASVPVHAHGHDEECLMVQGELFLDDVLLRAGDYQLAPAGTGHRITQTDTGVVIYAHGDLDLQLLDQS